MHTNRLAKETSPYLLQHAHNPVDWYPWGEEAFEKAMKEDKPIIVSIGYSTCHWCHVMERESFENEDVAAYMNQHFINIKVDREERPDVDQIYMAAVQAITRSGGWPLNCFLTPDKRPFFGGTYYPPTSAHNRPSWTEVLENINHIFKERRQEVEDQANELLDYMGETDERFISKINDLNVESQFSSEVLDEIYQEISKRFDQEDGGFGAAPKFPSAMSIQFLLNYYHFTKKENALDHAKLSLDKMIMGGIYDQIGGGFARYATDKAWLIPHFEKMLYDNALLVGTLSDAYKLTGEELYKETIDETLTFIEREMTSSEGGFYAAQDADSEGVEGKYYVWTKEEIDEILGEDARLFTDFYGVSEKGNWEQVNILWRKERFEEFASIHELNEIELKHKLKACRERLFQVRNQRIKPGLDDKILLDWNALMATAYAKAYTATGSIAYREAAERNITFLLNQFQKEKHKYFHTYKDGKSQYDAFLADYAYLIEALIEIYFITFNVKYLNIANELTEYVINNFYDAESGLFFFTNAQQTDIVIRKKELYDNATPSGNSTMVRNLQRLGIFFEKEEYRKMAKETILTVMEAIKQYPNSFARWANVLMNEIIGIHEIAVVGEKAFEKANTINSWFIPNSVIMATNKNASSFPLLADKNVLDSKTMVYVCKDYACQVPLEDLKEVRKSFDF